MMMTPKTVALVDTWRMSSHILFLAVFLGVVMIMKVMKKSTEDMRTKNYLYVKSDNHLWVKNEHCLYLRM